ncbi:hypothetical protein EI94DRAFT_1706953 [Lactarius quietus]|nr:hypothetical protein EI94DRAFT_1706953 [Lactarius quietus]
MRRIAKVGGSGIWGTWPSKGDKGCHEALIAILGGRQKGKGLMNDFVGHNEGEDKKDTRRMYLLGAWASPTLEKCLTDGLYKDWVMKRLCRINTLKRNQPNLKDEDVIGEKSCNLDFLFRLAVLEVIPSETCEELKSFQGKAVSLGIYRLHVDANIALACSRCKVRCTFPASIMWSKEAGADWIKFFLITLVIILDNILSNLKEFFPL